MQANDRQIDFSDLFPDDIPSDHVLEQRIDAIAVKLQKEGRPVNPVILTFFKDPELMEHLPDSICNDSNLLAEYITHSSHFFMILAGELRKPIGVRGLFGDYTVAPAVPLANGVIRPEEKERYIDVDYLREIGIDVSKVLVFRGTEKSQGKDKPEYFWSTDYWEVVGGLDRETNAAQRRNRVISVSDLETINRNGGLIMDKNDCANGIALRQLGTDFFPHQDALCVFRHSRYEREDEK